MTYGGKKELNKRKGTAEFHKRIPCKYPIAPTMHATWHSQSHSNRGM